MSHEKADISKLLEDTKVKPIVFEKREEPEAPSATVDLDELAREIVGAVFYNAPKGVKAEDVGHALFFACKEAADQHSVTKGQVFEAVMGYCIEAIDRAQFIEEVD